MRFGDDELMNYGCLASRLNLTSGSSFVQAAVSLPIMIKQPIFDLKSPWLWPLQCPI